MRKQKEYSGRLTSLRVRRTDRVLWERPGTTLIELAACCFLMAVIGGSLLPLLSRMDAARENHRHRLTALLELENLSERAALIPASEISQERLIALAKAMRVEERLPGTTLEINIREDAGKPSGKQIRYRLTRESAREGTRELALLEQWFFNEEKH